MDSTDDRRKDSGEAPRSLERLRASGGVPEGYAEKAMNSLMSLHSDLMAEKERTLDLTRRLLEERQSRAEVESYVRLLEAEVARLGGPDLRGLHGRGDDLVRAGEALLQEFRGENAEAASPVAPEAEAPGSSSEEAPDVAARGSSPEEAPAPRPRLSVVPTPPPPSPGYRPPVLPDEPDEAAELAQSREADPAPAPRPPSAVADAPVRAEAGGSETRAARPSGGAAMGEGGPARAAGAEDWRQW